MPFLRAGQRMWGSFMQGIVNASETGAAVLFNLLTPQSGGVSYEELSGQDLAPRVG